METPAKALIIRFSSIGDIVLASPLLRVLRQKMGKSARIDFAVKKEFSELVQFNHHLSLTHEYDPNDGLIGLLQFGWQLRQERYDTIFDIHDSVRSRILRWIINAPKVYTVDKRKNDRNTLVKKHRNTYREIISVAERYIETARDFGLQYDGKGLEIFIPDSTQFDVNGKLARLRLNKFQKVVGLCPGAKHFTKRWSEERFADLGVELSKTSNAKILLFGGPDETEQCGRIAKRISERSHPDAAEDFSGKFSLLEATHALGYCDIVITNDSALMHIAAAQQRKIVALFGSTVREFGFFPFGTTAKIVEVDNLECRPCTHIGKNKCPLGHFRCMSDISLQMVLNAVNSLE